MEHHKDNCSKLCHEWLVGGIMPKAADKAQSSPCQLPLRQDSHLQVLDTNHRIVITGIWAIATVSNLPDHILNKLFAKRFILQSICYFVKKNPETTHFLNNCSPGRHTTRKGQSRGFNTSRKSACWGSLKRQTYCDIKWRNYHRSFKKRLEKLNMTIPL